MKIPEGWLTAEVLDIGVGVFQHWHNDEATLKEKLKMAIGAMLYAAPTQPEIDALKAEVAHWKANHANMVNRSRVLIDRPDCPLERVKAFRQLEILQAENEKLRKAAIRLIDYFDEVKDCTGRANYGKVCELVTKLGAAMTPDTKGE